MKKIELLAPAKDIESGKAAITFGADAVYIGAPKFGARAAAGNSLEDIKSLIDFAHRYYSRVYITLNTILHDDELVEAQKLIYELHAIGADAIIIQDMGILELEIPPIPLFASTQTNNFSWQKVKFLEDAGIQRVILARELSLEQLHEIRKNTSVDLEFFVHGALCVSFSGQCYFSHAIDKGSANRGACAQPCRAYYSLLDKNGKVLTKDRYLLSLKDLNLSDHIGELMDAGISSFKIEGRLKDINYLKNITAFYRKKIDEAIKERKEYSKSSSGEVILGFNPDPERTFNRGYTSYFLKSRSKSIASPDTQKSIGKVVGKVKSVSDKYFTIDSHLPLSNADGICFFDERGDLQGTLVNKVEGNKVYVENLAFLKVGTIIYRNYDHEFNKQLASSKTERKVRATIKIEESYEGIIIRAEDEDGNRVELIENFAKEIAVNTEKANPTIVNQFKKSGDSIFRVDLVEVDIKNPLFFPISVLNELRRKTLELLELERQNNFPKQEKEIKKTDHHYPEKFLDYKGNILNQKAISFYERHGVKMIENAFEIQNDFTNKEIMVTKHCIKYQMGLCPKHGEPETKVEEPLYLADNNRKYKLEFDCKQCAMKVIFLQ
jgi:23S rRNA 5-hydroxycytidine C2501 synthase